MTQRRALLFVALGAALLGLLGVLVRGSMMPAGILLVVRMSIGGLAVAAVFGRRGVVRQACRPNV